METCNRSPEDEAQKILSEHSLQDLENGERSFGVQGPIDSEAVSEFNLRSTHGAEDLCNHEHARRLIEHILKPFAYRKEQMIPSWDAEQHLETYFPVLFPTGSGGPLTLRMRLADWAKHVLHVKDSRFTKSLDFIFFVHTVLRRKRLAGLALNAPLRDRTSQALVGIRQALSTNKSSGYAANQIERLLRSGILNASFETLRGTPAFWSTMRRTAWAYLQHFGPCQVFITISPADLTDPYLFMGIDDTLSFDQARLLSASERSKLLAENPVSAAILFHRKVEAFFKCFLFGKTKPFGEIEAYLGRVEQQSRLSPHLQILIWTKRKPPPASEPQNRHAYTKGITEFVESFCTANLRREHLFESKYKASAFETWKPETYLKLRKRGIMSSPKSDPTLSGKQKRAALSNPFNPSILDGSPRNNDVMREMTVAAQYHKCQPYCLREKGTCRFFFPFPLQERASIAMRSESDCRQIALSPRTNSFINSTHPLLTAMFRCNTDVTVICGNSIAESNYVCSYAVKADKTPLFDKRALRKLKHIQDGSIDKRYLLSSIARASEGVRIIGAQEAVDNLLCYPLTFKSAVVLNISTSFLLSWKGAISSEEEDCFFSDSRYEKSYDILSEMDDDEIVSVPPSKRTKQKANAKTSQAEPELVVQYMHRPFNLEKLSILEFHGQYVVRKSRRSRDINNRKDTTHENEDKYIIRKRHQKANPTAVTHIVNVPSRGLADVENPSFAAAALLLHMQFRTISQLLAGHCLTERLKAVLKSQDERYSEVHTYVNRAFELSHSYTARRQTDNSGLLTTQMSENDRDDLFSSEVGPSEDDEFDECLAEEMLSNPLEGLPSLIAAEGNRFPEDVDTCWTTARKSSNSPSLNCENYRLYVRQCKRVGIISANALYANESSNQENVYKDLSRGTESDHMGYNASAMIYNSFHHKTDILRSCRTTEQREWLQKVLGYLQVYYLLDPADVPNHKIDECKQNHPIVTSAPGGCGKTWLVKNVVRFMNTSVPLDCAPIYVRQLRCNEANISSTIEQDSPMPSPEDYPIGRLGRVAMLAPSGVAASNGGGYTIHDALRAGPLSFGKLYEEMSPKRHRQLSADFARVVAIVVDEFSMVSLLLLAYLDQVLRILRPGLAHIPYAGVSIILVGDAFQLPVVRAHGLLSDPNSIPDTLLPTYDFFTKGSFFLTLSESIRQGEDLKFFRFLSRLRFGTCTENDVELINTRYTQDISALVETCSDWAYAPILTSRNASAVALNNASIFRNGTRLGTAHIRSSPKLPARINQTRAKKKAMQIYYRKRQKRSTTDGFSPGPTLVVYPGMPVMLRANLCPALGLANGAIGKIVSIIHDDNAFPLRENLEATIDRMVESEEKNRVPSLLIDFGDNYKGAISAIKPTGVHVLDRKAHSVVLIDPMQFPRAYGLPISVSHSFTMHKAQSLTLKKVLVDLRGTFCMGALYVAFSRAPSLQSVAVIAKVTIDMLNKHSKQAGNCIHILGEIAKQSMNLDAYCAIADGYQEHIEGSLYNFICDDL